MVMMMIIMMMMVIPPRPTLFRCHKARGPTLLHWIPTFCGVDPSHVSGKPIAVARHRASGLTEIITSQDGHNRMIRACFPQFKISTLSLRG
jgi:hypothetical protein